VIRLLIIVFIILTFTFSSTTFNSLQFITITVSMAEIIVILGIKTWR